MAADLPDHDDLDDGLDDALKDRLVAGVSRVTPRHDSMAVLRHHVGRRRRRRRIVATVAAAAAVAVVLPAALVAVQLVDGDTEVEPASPSSTPTIALDGTRPVAFFVRKLDGRARGQLTRYAPAPGERYHASFLWWSDVDGQYPVRAGASIEAYDGSPQEACDALVLDDATSDPLATSRCATTADGSVVRIVDSTADGVRLDPLNRRGRLEGADPGDAVRAATVFQDSGFAVTLTVCACQARGGPDLAEPPLSGDELGEAAADPAWVATIPPNG